MKLIIILTLIIGVYSWYDSNLNYIVKHICYDPSTSCYDQWQHLLSIGNSLYIQEKKLILRSAINECKATRTNDYICESAQNLYDDMGSYTSGCIIKLILCVILVFAVKIYSFIKL